MLDDELLGRIATILGKDVTHEKDTCRSYADLSDNDLNSIRLLDNTDHYLAIFYIKHIIKINTPIYDVLSYLVTVAQGGISFEEWNEIYLQKKNLWDKQRK